MIDLGSLFLAVKQFIINSLINAIEYFLGPYSLRSLALDNHLNESERLERVEWALRRNSSARLRNYDWESGNETEEAEGLLEDEVSDNEYRNHLAKKLSNPLRILKGYKKLCQEVEERRSELYDSENEKHEKKLFKLWKLLKPEEELEARKTKKWQDIGFQGDDPATDFRGMGVLGLDQLIFFAQFDVEKCQKVLEISKDPILGFPFAIAGITFTALCRQFLKDELLKNHFVNSCHRPPTIDNFHQVYCRLFSLFGDYWIYKHPESVMQFNQVKEQFILLLTQYLRSSESNLMEVHQVEGIIA
ncbi:unnamed protein product [Bursaphelenchus okinawaensis]|uniref:ELMO domain-containing protein n=1 Tax=Bursaphelenchus okinawaensis TaxID=465554 RepID=A0A811LN53_9BILA|nr:unnamed protein product [Bursaphelenchus okinawaensis]CAG9126866.1 unnamed protein product [Bursaphelenchus okinawaensis]